ncbi:MAG: heme-binding domain-containing protein [Bacteroidia bacterium]|nr:heme-binding domain-containing protein [Bacteroidia bacterium]HQV01304.1 heme-binding domain-containing protein [Bacteroidia bacterium]
MKQKIILSLLLLFVVIQFFQPSQHNNTTEATQSFADNVPVGNILKKACNDCHSNYTHYPWYSKVQPAGWYLQNHVNEGRSELNFDSLLSYTAKRQDHKLEEIIEVLELGEMPLSSYTLLHPEAKLDSAEKQILMNWAKEMRIKLNYQ